MLSSVTSHGHGRQAAVFFSPWGASPPAQKRNLPSCLCGTPLAVAVGQWLCLHCGRAFCRDCGGTVARSGGCDVCTVCGAGSCE